MSGRLSNLFCRLVDPNEKFEHANWLIELNYIRNDLSVLHCLLCAQEFFDNVSDRDLLQHRFSICYYSYNKLILPIIKFCNRFPAEAGTIKTDIHNFGLLMKGLRMIFQVTDDILT